MQDKPNAALEKCRLLLRDDHSWRQESRKESDWTKEKVPRLLKKVQKGLLVPPKNKQGRTEGLVPCESLEWARLGRPAQRVRGSVQRHAKRRWTWLGVQCKRPWSRNQPSWWPKSSKQDHESLKLPESSGTEVRVNQHSALNRIRKVRGYQK